MKLLRYGPQGSEKPGLMDDRGQIRDLSEVVKDIDPDFFAGDGLRKVAALDVNLASVTEKRYNAVVRFNFHWNNCSNFITFYVVFRRFLPLRSFYVTQLPPLFPKFTREASFFPSSPSAVPLYHSVTS